MKNKIVASPQTQDDANKIARATQKPGQTKEQTKLIAQGIEKGIALYKKEQKEKQRQAYRARKKALKSKQSAQSDDNNIDSEPSLNTTSSSPAWQTRLPWILLIVSWIGFALYITLA
ncbi:DUF2956 domain-containing protein [Vibrio sp. H11]|uniref:DUF2956 domain-containing protein n=1 Tax=Vibrio sp. H11 TaxID=2565928 RepID=UPI0010A65798|nr:DUF2956 domain-containing protein [Vibrio sp. H11]